MMMKVLFFGDIVGRPGRRAIKKILPKLKKKYVPDLVIANGENLAHGKGITKGSLDEVLASGVDLVTSGNHIWEKKEAFFLLDDKKIPLLRPSNWSKEAPGEGHKLFALRTKKILVINLIGRVFMRKEYDNPFSRVNEILDEYSLADDVNAVIVDWHAEATSEKMAMGWHLDGRVSAVIGTHTHIPTADARILPQGTAYISDVGMVGPQDSILGVDKDIALKGFLTGLPQKLEVAEGNVEVDAVIIEIDNKTGLAENIEKIQEIVD